MPLFGRSFSVFSPGNRRGAMAPAPIILATAGLRIAVVNFPHANIVSGANVRAVAGVSGFIIRPINWSGMKNFSVAYAPTNATFSLRYGAAGAALTGAITPQVTSIGRRYDSAALVISNHDQNTDGGADLNIFPNAGNGNGNAANRLQFVIVYCLDPIVQL